MSKISIVFFGTGPVSLRALEGVSAQFVIEAVFTKPLARKVGGRPPQKQIVASWAKSHQVPYFEPATTRALAAFFQPGDFTSKVGLVVDYGLILDSKVIDYFPLGIINSHFSLLPEWRGADPITYALLSGQKVTGVSLMSIVPKLDEGPLIAQEKFPIPPQINIQNLTEQLTDLSNTLLIKTIPRYVEGKAKLYPQPKNIKTTYSRRITKADGKIDWNKPATQIAREVRAYLGWPGSFTVLAGKAVKILAAEVAPYRANQPGLICNVNGELHVETGKDSLKITNLQVAGKNPISGADFLRGYARPQLKNVAP